MQAIWPVDVVLITITEENIHLGTCCVLQTNEVAFVVAYS